VNATEQQRGRSQRHPNSAFNMMALTASAGRLKARCYFLAGPATNVLASPPAVQSVCPEQANLLADILSHRTALMVKQTMDGDVLRLAPVFIPVPDRHPIVIPDGTVSQASRDQFVLPLYDLVFALRMPAVALGVW
jgi:two-component system chemotaxis response regulator CheB